MKNNLSAVLIAHNEEGNIGRMIEGLLENYHDELLEIIVVSDSSTDRTSDIVREWMARDNKVRLIEKGDGKIVKLRSRGGKLLLIRFWYWWIHGI